MPVTQQPVPTQTFVVGLDRAEVLRRRATVRRTQVFGIWVTGVGFAIMAGFVLGMAIGFDLGGGMWWFAILIVVSMLPLLFSVEQSRRRLAASKKWFAGAELPPWAMRMSSQALELGCEGAPMPVVLPWQAVQGFKQRRRFGQPVLELVLAPGVGPGTPGVSGLEQPAAASALTPSKMVKPIGFYGVAALDQPLGAIDQALRSFSGGRVGVSN